MCFILASTFDGCHSYIWPSTRRRFAFWTAGQRIDPSSRTPFIWRVTSTIAGFDSRSEMRYVNWDAGQPDYYENGSESCVQLPVGYNYRWNDSDCQDATCSICELDLVA